MPTTYIRKKLKDENGNYIITPSMADMVYHNDGETVERKYTDLKNEFKSEIDVTNQQLSQMIKIADWYFPQNIKGTVLGTNGIPSAYNSENYESFFNWILNPLVNDYPDYVSKVNLGKDTSNTFNVYRYDFTPENYDRTMVILSNVHGNEYTSFFGICRFLDEICRKYKTDSNLYFLRNKVRLIVFPIVNPWGFVNSNRRNVNGVDLNRNSSYRWEEYTSVNGQIGGKYYKGSTPFSEKESQYIKQTLDSLDKTDFVGFVDLHTLNTIEAEKVLYYPRFAENIVSKFSKVLNRFKSETELDRQILSSSAVPTFSNWVAHTYKVNACNPEFSNSVYGKKRNDFLMTKHVEWISNLILTIAKENRRAKSSNNGPHSYLLMWNRDTSLTETEDDNRNSNKGHRVFKSENYNTFNLSQRNIEITEECIVDFHGHVRVYAEKDCTLYLEPLVYQQYSPEQNYNTMIEENRYEEIIRLSAGQEIYIPITAILQGFHTNYNDESSSRSAYVHFRLRTKSDVANAVWLTGYKVVINCIPSDLGKCVTVEKSIQNQYQTVYPLRIIDDIED